MVLEEVFYSGESPSLVVQEKGYTQISDKSAVKVAVSEAIAANPKAVSDYLGGKDAAIRYLIGQVMKITLGQANPEVLNQLVLKELEVCKGSSVSKETSRLDSA